LLAHGPKLQREIELQTLAYIERDLRRLFAEAGLPHRDGVSPRLERERVVFAARVRDGRALYVCGQTLELDRRAGDRRSLRIGDHSDQRSLFHLRPQRER
jgi:hypothetical protein